VHDNALTRPWSITKTVKRSPKARPLWRTAVCAENNTRVKIEDENYFLSADGKLMPTRGGQPPPDLQYFTRKQRCPLVDSRHLKNCCQSRREPANVYPSSGHKRCRPLPR
jgi:hypothetical protein